MCGFGVRRLPVVEPGGGLVGLVSLSDVARGELAADRGLGRGLRDEITGALAILCPPRTPVPRAEAEVSEH
jgi:hypothetical protein